MIEIDAERESIFLCSAGNMIMSGTIPGEHYLVTA